MKAVALAICTLWGVGTQTFPKDGGALVVQNTHTVSRSWCGKIKLPLPKQAWFEDLVIRNVLSLCYTSQIKKLLQMREHFAARRARVANGERDVELINSHRESKPWGWRDGLPVKSACDYCGGLGLGSQHSHSDSPPHVTPVWMLSLGPSRTFKVTSDESTVMCKWVNCGNPCILEEIPWPQHCL